jgi:hypothetical protein
MEAKMELMATKVDNIAIFLHIPMEGTLHTSPPPSSEVIPFRFWASKGEVNLEVVSTKTHQTTPPRMERKNDNLVEEFQVL